MLFSLRYNLSHILLLVLMPIGGAVCWAQEVPDSVSNMLDDITITSRRLRSHNRYSATNSELLTRVELTRAACCNLGESFTTNPSVDVNYTDAATGARQVRLLGLSGQYVQMLTENIPNFRGAAAPYGLGYIPGPWMQSIMVSKGTSSVKNGYEAITGQINVEMLKPQADPSITLNGYYDSMNKSEANLCGNLPLGKGWWAGMLSHYERENMQHDANADSFADFPRLTQLNLMPRLAYMGSNYIMQAAAKVIDETRQGGQIGELPANPYKIDIDTRRYEIFAKNAFILDRATSTNLALILSATSHNQRARYGLRRNDIDQRELYASLMFERTWQSLHALSTGLSYVDDRHLFHYLQNSPINHHERVAGAYAQYTLTLPDNKLVAMAGMRLDRSSLYGTMFTPRMHLRYNPTSSLSLHGSVGRGFRAPLPLAEFSYMLASSRQLVIAPKLSQEKAWNTGLGSTITLRPGGEQELTLAADYYFTYFQNYLMLNLEKPHLAEIYSLKDGARSHALQLELTYKPIDELSLLAAWRYTSVEAQYNLEHFSPKPLISPHKGLFTISWNPNMAIWQVDATLALNSGGVMPTPYVLENGSPSWAPHFKPYSTLNLQVTRNFRHWALYIGGENLTNYRQPNPVIGASNPWGPDFDATMIYGPLKGAMIYAGFRYNFTKY